MFKDFIYKNYLEAPYNLTFEDAMKIYEDIIAAAPEDDPDFEAAWSYALERMTAYADLRAHWKITPKSERDNDQRTIMHDSVIESLDQLAEYMSSQNRKTTWRIELGFQRKRIGDFACYVSMIYGLFAR